MRNYEESSNSWMGCVSPEFLLGRVSAKYVAKLVCALATACSNDDDQTDK